MKILENQQLRALFLMLLLSAVGPQSVLAQAEEQAETEVVSAAPAEDPGEATDEISEEDRATMALDSTATQWSFQFAWQVMPDYHDDVLPSTGRSPA